MTETEREEIERDMWARVGITDLGEMVALVKKFGRDRLGWTYKGRRELANLCEQLSRRAGGEDVVPNLRLLNGPELTVLRKVIWKEQDRIRRETPNRTDTLTFLNTLIVAFDMALKRYERENERTEWIMQTGDEAPEATVEWSGEK